VRHECTWVDTTGGVHNDNLEGPGTFSFPTVLGRNGLTSLTVGADDQNMTGQAVFSTPMKS